MILCTANNPDLTYSLDTLNYILRRCLNILRGRRKYEEYAERNILGWNGLLLLMFKILEKSNSRDIYGHK
jgi:hypothetical protein